ILYRFHDTGVDNKVTHTRFAYANGNPVGQTGNTEDNLTGTETLLDTGRYHLVQPLGEDFPASTVDNVYHSVPRDDVAQSVLDGIDPKHFKPKSRFGGAFYVSEVPETTLAELSS